MNRISNPPTYNTVTYEFRMSLLPTGQVLLANQTMNLQVYTPDGMPDPSWRPQITGSPANVQPENTYTLQGRDSMVYRRQSRMVMMSVATNYPLVRIRNVANNHIAYCRTHDHSTMGLQTGTVIHSTHFTIPLEIDTGPSELCVVANGISSVCVSVLVNNEAGSRRNRKLKKTSNKKLM